MLYEMFWLFYALMIVILVSVGLWGIFFFASIPARRIKVTALVLSVIIILAGLYFSYQWNVDTHGQARGTCQKQALLDALRANSHSPTAKAVELCPSGRLEKKKIQIFAQQIEETINKYLATHKK